MKTIAQESVPAYCHLESDNIVKKFVLNPSQPSPEKIAGLAARHILKGETVTFDPQGITGDIMKLIE